MKTEKPLTLGSLFDGSGGFPLGGLLAGITPVYNTALAYPIGIAVAVLFLGIFLYTIKKRHTQPHYETLGK